MTLWKTVAQDIEEKTLNFWRVSRAWNNQSQVEMITGEAIVYCTDNLKYTNPERPVARYTTKLLQELIRGEGSPPPSATSLILFPDTLDAIVAESIQ